jgi:hypothetical protein
MNKIIKIMTFATVISLSSVPQIVLAGSVIIPIVLARSVIIIPIPLRVSPDEPPEETTTPDVPVVEAAKVEASDDYKWKTTEKPKPTGSVKEW